MFFVSRGTLNVSQRETFCIPLDVRTHCNRASLSCQLRSSRKTFLSFLTVGVVCFETELCFF